MLPAIKRKPTLSIGFTKCGVAFLDTGGPCHFFFPQGGSNWSAVVVLRVTILAEGKPHGDMKPVSSARVGYITDAEESRDDKHQVGSRAHASESYIVYINAKVV